MRIILTLFPRASYYQQKFTTLSSNLSSCSSITLKQSDATGGKVKSKNNPGKPTSSVHEKNSFSIKTWRAPNHASEFPEASTDLLIGKKNFGIALSGGGMRAASNALGWLRTFNSNEDKGRINAFNDAKYISVNSGASWVTIIALFAAAARMQSDDSVTEFSVAFREPLENGSKYLSDSQFLLRVRQGLRTALRKHNLEFILDFAYWLLRVPREKADERAKSEQNFWCRAVKEFMKTNQVDPEYIAASDNFGQKVTGKVPFLIVAGAIQQVEMKTFKLPGFIFGSYKVVDAVPYAVPFEFTPAYCGVPVSNPTDGLFNHAGFIQPWAFNCDYSNDDSVYLDDASQEVRLLRINPVKGFLTKMSDVSGVSSSAVVQGFFESFFEIGQKSKVLITILKEILPQFHFWLPVRSRTDGSYSLLGGNYGFTDGGSFDNSAALNLLRRGVKNIAICYSNTSDVLDRRTFQKGHRDFMSLFDLASPANDPNYNKWRRVFPQAVWGKLLAALQVERDNNRPAVAYLEGVEVLDNPFAGVRAYTANILFAFNDRPSTKFIEEHRELLQKTKRPADRSLQSFFKPKGLDSDFPFIPFTYLSYTDDLTEMLVKNTTHNLKNSPNLQLFLDEMRK